MSPSRIAILLAVLGAFVAGVSIGMYVSSPSDASILAKEQSETTPLAQKSALQGSSNSGATGLGGEVGIEGNAIAKRFWTALTIADEQERLADWLAMLPSVTAENAPEIRELFRKMDRQGRWFIPEWNVFWKRWGEVDAAAALKDIEKVGSKYHPDLTEKILKGWATTKSAEARAWLEANPSSPSYQSALRGYLDGLARTNLDRATQDALTLGKGHNTHRLVEVLTEQALRQRELGGMIEWWKSLPEESEQGTARREAIQHVYWRLQKSSNERAGQWLAELASTPYRAETQMGNLAERMAEANPAKALEWVASLPPSPENGRYTAIGRTVTALARTDAPALEEWLKGLSPSPLRDQSVVAYAKHLDQQAQREAAEQWRIQVQDQQWLQPPANSQTLYIETFIGETPR